MSIFDDDLVTNEKIMPIDSLIEFYAYKKIDELTKSYGNEYCTKYVELLGVDKFSMRLNIFLNNHSFEVIQYINQNTESTVLTAFTYILGAKLDIFNRRFTANIDIVISYFDTKDPPRFLNAVDWTKESKLNFIKSVEIKLKEV